MTITKRGEYHYGEGHEDLHDLIELYAKAAGFSAEVFADAYCACEAKVFELYVDDEEGVAVRVCTACGADHPIGDSAQFLDEAELQQCECPCGAASFEVSSGACLHEDSDAVKWFYLAGRCTSCNFVAVFGDWKNEHESYEVLLSAT
jgi:nitrite reductase/ring-hydroxylating ferredoxin subunit